MTGGQPVEQFTKAEAVATLAETCGRSGIAEEGAELVRLGENAIIRISAKALVVRIGRNLEVLTDARKEVAVAAWLHDAGLPAAETTAHKQPIIVRNKPVTFWKLIDDSGSRPTLAALGTILRTLHSLAVPDGLGLPSFNMFDRVLPRIQQAEVLTDRERTFLIQRLEDLRRDYDDLVFALPPSAVHGDAHQGNLIQTPDGSVILIDFERFAFGAPETDLSMTATEYLIGWHSDADYESFCDACGFDITRWDGFPVLRAINELKMTTWLMQNVGESEQIANEFRTRLASLHNDDAPRDWHPF
jgi:aminoglycoside phosphotransferase (APT) family kinase protein